MFSFSLFLLVIIRSSLQSPIRNLTGCLRQKSSTEVEVFITVSSLTLSATKKGVVNRQLEINWLGGRKPETGDVVAIYDRDPRGDQSRGPVFAIDPSEYPGGYVRTRVELSFIFFNLSSLSHHPCLGYWAAYLDRNGKILASSCLQTRPFWMENIAPYLNSQTLEEVMIPGSHDSGSFDFHREKTPLVKYKYAQEESIFNQLVYGLRYFDLRVGYYKRTPYKYYINHNFLRTEHSVESVLDQVLEFLKATKEIVILDLHNFPIGFRNAEIHVLLMDLIIDKFGPLLIPFTEEYQNATFRHLWQKDKRILVSYNSKFRRYRPRLLWPGIPRAWGNKQHPEDLKRYFERVFSQPLPSGLWASMAELTPNTRTIVLHPETGLRVFADEINRNVTHWFRDLFWQKANVVATDYFLGNNLIDVAIETNRIKIHCPRRYQH